jgi:hypothetical protein
MNADWTTSHKRRFQQDSLLHFFLACSLALAQVFTLQTAANDNRLKGQAQSGVKTGSNRFRIIDFHTTKSVGKLTAGHLNKFCDFVSTSDLGQAQGQVRVPNDTPVQLDVNFYGAAHLAFLEKLGPDDLFGLTLANGGAGFEIADADLSRLGRLTGLQYLDLEASEAAGKAMEAISHLTKLRSLKLANTNIKTKDTAALAKLSRLEYLSINHTDLSDQSFADIQNLTCLRGIHAKRCGLTGAGIKYLAKLVNLEELILSSDRIGDAGVKALPDMPRLYWLDLDDCQITPACLSSLARFPKLENVNVCWCAPTREAIEALSKIKNLHALEITGKTIYVPNLALLKNSGRLEKLAITVAPQEQSQASKLLPNVKVSFKANKSGVPIEVFAPLRF